MIGRVPPKLASWLLQVWGSSYHGESLAGDLIEQYQAGRSRAWYWKQVAAAVLGARSRYLRTLPWSAVGRVLARLIAECAAVLTVAVIVDHERRTDALAGMANLTFLGVLLALMTATLIGILASIRPGRRRRHAAINTVMLVFGVIALSVGTLTWADTTRRDACRTPACACSNEYE